MNNKTYSILQIIAVALLFIAVAIQVLLFFNVSARMTVIEQKQALLEHRLEVIRSEGGYP